MSGLVWFQTYENHMTNLKHLLPGSVQVNVY